MNRKLLGLTAGATLMMGLGAHGLAKAVSLRPELPALEGEWTAQVLESGADGLIEETRTFEIAFNDDNEFVSHSAAGAEGEGTYELRGSKMLRLKSDAGEEVYSVLPLNENVLSIYREGSQKAIYLVRN